jgi:anti-sigma B factor antagonist
MVPHHEPSTGARRRQWGTRPAEGEASLSHGRGRPLAFATVGSHDRFHPPGFSLEVTADEVGRSTVSVGGELDLATAEQFTTTVRAALAEGAVRIDLAEVSFMDSAGVRALNTALREAAEKGHELLVSERMQPAVVQILDLTGMSGLLPVERGR